MRAGFDWHLLPEQGSSHLVVSDRDMFDQLSKCADAFELSMCRYKVIVRLRHFLCQCKSRPFRPFNRPIENLYHRGWRRTLFHLAKYDSGAAQKHEAFHTREGHSYLRTSGPKPRTRFQRELAEKLPPILA